MPRIRTILHIDLDAFFCSVEENHQPKLVGKAFAVGGNPQERGVVASCSYAARRMGVRSAMPMSHAIRLCPHLMVVPPHFERYQEHSQRVMALLHNLTPLVEQLSVDEAFLDVTGLTDAPETIARRTQAQIKADCQLPSSIGVATNKLMAKIATNIGKSRQMNAQTPCAIQVIPHGTEKAFLNDLPITELWGVGQKTAEKMYRLNIQTIGDICRADISTLKYHFGKNGEDLWHHAHGRDERPVEPEQETKSISSETTFTLDIANRTELLQVLRQLSETIGRRLRKDNLMGSTIKLKLRWSDFTTISRQTTLHIPTNQDSEITHHATALFEQCWDGKRPIRLIGVGISHFDHDQRQLSLFDEPTEQPNRHLEQALDDLRDRFGTTSIRRASDLKHKD